jgi:hypothetical protein
MKIADPVKFARLISLFTCIQLSGQSKLITIYSRSNNNMYDFLRKFPSKKVKPS